MAKTNTNPEVRFAGFIEDWQKEFVGTYYDFKNGLNKSKEYFGYGKPIVNFTDVFHNRGLLSNQLNGKVDVTSDEINNYSVKKGDLFFTRTSETIEEIGQPSVMLDEPKQAVFSGFVLRARAINEDPLEIGFKQYAFFTNSFRSEMVKKSSMTTRALTSGTAIKKMLFTFPKSKTEQKLIGNFFENIDKLIAEHQQKHTKLKSLKKAMLDKMFPKQGQLVPEIRFKGSEGAWEVRKLGETKTFFTDGNYGEAYPTSDDLTDSGKGVPFLRGSNLSNGLLSVVGANYITYSKHLELTSGHLVEDDIVIAVRGSLGSLGYVEKKNIGWNINSQLAIIRTYKEELSGVFLLQYLLTDFSQTIIHSKCTGTALKQLPIGRLKEIKIPLTSLKEQQKIGNFFKKIDNLIDHHQVQTKKLSNIKIAFLAKMFI